MIYTPTDEFINELIHSLSLENEKNRIRNYCCQFQTKIIEFIYDKNVIRVYMDENLLYKYHVSLVKNQPDVVEFKLTETQTKNIVQAFFNENKSNLSL